MWIFSSAVDHTHSNNTLIHNIIHTLQRIKYHFNDYEDKVQIGSVHAR